MREVSANSVLLVDDDPSMRELLSVELEEIGFKARLAEDGIDGLVKLRDELPRRDTLRRGRRLDGEIGPSEACSMSRHTLPFNSRNFLKRVGAQKTTREYQDLQTIYLQGDAADAMFQIQNGNVKLVVASPRGKQAVVAILGPGDVFGEGCVVKGSLRKSTATAIQLSTITCVKKATLVRLIITIRPLQNFLSLSCFLEWAGSKKIIWIDFSISARSAWRGFFCCFTNLGQKAKLEIQFPKSIRNSWPKWWAPPGTGQPFHEQIRKAGLCRLP